VLRVTKDGEAHLKELQTNLIYQLVDSFAGMTEFLLYPTKRAQRSSRFGADCAKRLSDSALVCVEWQTFVQGVPKLLLR